MEPEDDELDEDLLAIDPLPPFVDDDLRAELDRRWQEHLDHPELARPWEEVRDELFRRKPPES
jgi:putative addiction module component (TIGR02574 family)